MPIVLDANAINSLISASDAVELTRSAFELHQRGEWEMPPKVYVEAPPGGDFRAMPARGGGYAVLKWVTSFPDNPARGLPVVAGALLLSDAGSGALVAICDCAAVTSLRTGAAAAVSAEALAREGARTVGLIGCGVNGGWAARCLAARGYGPGRCADLDPARAAALADELGWEATDRERACEADVIVTVTPGGRPVVAADELSPGAHLAMLGADGAEKAELAAGSLASMRVFCDEWTQASRGGELAGPVARGEITRERVGDLGAVLLGAGPGRRSEEEITMFDSTGLAIQDLGIAIAAYERARAGGIEAPEIEI